MIPSELAAVNQWVVWKYEERNGKKTKVPYSAISQKRCSCAAAGAKTWTDYETAKECAVRFDFDGIGFVFSKEAGFVGIDIDHCLDADQMPDELAQDILNNAPRTYIEVSPSGTGLHIFVRGKKPHTGCRSGNVEIYDSNRFFTVTEEAWLGSSETVADGQELIDHIMTKYVKAPEKPAPPPVPVSIGSTPRTFDDILAKAGRDRDNLERLIKGDISAYSRVDKATGELQADPSKADLALCSKLAFYTQGDADQIDALFRQSGLMRPKWDELRGEQTYGQRTIEKALAGNPGRYDPDYKEKVIAQLDAALVAWEAEHKDVTAASVAEEINTDRADAGTADTTAPDSRSVTITKEAQDALERLAVKPTDFTDVAQGAVLAKKFSRRLRYCVNFGWLYYDGTRWVSDDLQAQAAAQYLTEAQMQAAGYERHMALEAMNRAQAEQNEDRKQELLGKANKAKEAADKYYAHALKMRHSARIKAAQTEARPHMAIKPNALDTDPYLLNCPGGTVDLRTGELREHRPEDYITHVTAADPSDDGKEIWLEFLDQITCGNAELADFLQMCAGMDAIGKVTEEVIQIHYGSGGNGKSTYHNTIQKALGSYAETIKPDILLKADQINAHRFDLADLFGKRRVVAGELEDGKTLDTAQLKKVASVDKIKAEKKYKDPFEFYPSHSTILFTNPLPRINSNDHGTWRRIALVPWKAKFTDQPGEIKDYAEYLFQNCAGYIMTWIIEGAKRFIDNGSSLTYPQIVKDETAAYRDASGWINPFIRISCVVESDATVQASELYKAYREYATSHTRRPLETDKAFYKALEEAGFQKRRSPSCVLYRGLRLRTSEDNKPGCLEFDGMIDTD